MGRTLLTIVATCFLLHFGHAACAQEKPEGEAPPPPKLAMSVPLAIPVAATSKVIVRGWNLAETSEVRSNHPQVTFEIKAKGSANIPGGQDAKTIGDTQVELEATIGPDVEPGEIELVVVTSAGESAPYSMALGGTLPSLIEQEANDGFRQAQPIQIPQLLDGQIHGDRNVDVYTFELAAEETLAIEVHAARRGSGLDSLLTLFDQAGNQLAVNDDHADTLDSRVAVTLPGGTYYLSLQDAHDHGGPAHPYRLSVQAAP